MYEFVNALMHGVTDVVTPLTEIDTRRQPVARTVKTKPWESSRPNVPACADGPLTVGDLVARSPLSEVWRATLANGSARVVSVLFGCAGPGDPNVGKLGRLRHPNVQPIEVLQHTPGRLVLCQSTGEPSLRDVMQTYQGRGTPGIPRRELLAYLRTAAETLHHFQQKDGLQHLGLNPKALLLDGTTLRLANLGLAQLVWLPVGQNVAQLNARYSAPELTLRQISPACDQYSLALIYHELLTGAYPAPGKPTRKGETAVPALDRLPADDRMLIARALHPDPKHRWGSMLELLRALDAATPADEPAVPAASAATTKHIAPALTQPVAESGSAMQMRFGTSLTPGTIRERLEAFRQHWKAKEVAAEASRVVYEMPAPRNFWQRWTGQQPGLEITFGIGAPDVSVPAGVQTRTEVRLDLSARDCTKDEGRQLLERVGPLLVESARQHLQMGARGRAQERLPWHHAFQLCPVGADGERGAPVECQGKDVSLNGIGFYVQAALPSAQVLLSLPQTTQTPKMTVPARVVRVQSFGDGWFEVGAVLQPPDELPPDEDEAG